MRTRSRKQLSAVEEELKKLLEIKYLKCSASTPTNIVRVVRVDYEHFLTFLSLTGTTYGKIDIIALCLDCVPLLNELEVGYYKSVIGRFV